jgi:DNA adenine methylase
MPHLVKYWSSDYLRYMEPFAGSATLFFNISPSRALLSDLNPHLIETFIQVRDALPAVLAALRPLNNRRDIYLRLRGEDPLRLSPPKRAARFIYLNRYCFNGLYRTNSHGQFNVPYGGAKSGSLPTPAFLRLCSHHLSPSTISCCDFESALEEAKPGDFIYMDPPFSVARRRVFKEYHQATFGPSDLHRLRGLLLDLDNRGVAFLVSYARSKEANSLAGGFHVETRRVRRHISGFASARAYAQELLISNSPPE